ncbi:MAG: type II toxin-antitoxin system prevent-host-death family antitoxin [Eubacteriales bacterium]|nr:type II toxin-antitoxin system prevent-host-death family antitoxin [Bacillota bacterium]MBV1726804.1 type II toxin-antitoxin system prevent-host-death family antitoxin [Desulforudis sp.]MDZ4043016.1 type II toxin-antitoxin system prevent-host-death family antitoxin [Eubacteriales bacterium]MBV1735797.1 type II toxin-antitoxin system prevent-host-death family antitoxin [Desulforudis sp.]MBV1768889.1 type II toxin-antitoxin system prevent-host-death family antitoxin [Desulforudis sp.]
MQVGSREIKTRFSQYLKRVKEGETITITVRSVPVARLVPLNSPVPEGIVGLIEAGLVSWSGGKPKGLSSPVKAQDTKTLADLVAEDRR